MKTVFIDPTGAAVGLNILRKEHFKEEIF